MTKENNNDTVIENISEPKNILPVLPQLPKYTTAWILKSIIDSGTSSWQIINRVDFLSDILPDDLKHYGFSDKHGLVIGDLVAVKILKTKFKKFQTNKKEDYKDLRDTLYSQFKMKLHFDFDNTRDGRLIYDYEDQQNLQKLSVSREIKSYYVETDKLTGAHYSMCGLNGRDHLIEQDVDCSEQVIQGKLKAITFVNPTNGLHCIEYDMLGTISNLFYGQHNPQIITGSQLQCNYIDIKNRIGTEFTKKEFDIIKNIKQEEDPIRILNRTINSFDDEEKNIMIHQCIKLLKTKQENKK